MHLYWITYCMQDTVLYLHYKKYYIYWSSSNPLLGGTLDISWATSGRSIGVVQCQWNKIHNNNKSKTTFLHFTECHHEWMAPVMFLPVLCRILLFQTYRVPAMARVYVTRRETFSAAHRLHAPALSDEENKKVRRDNAVNIFAEILTFAAVWSVQQPTRPWSQLCSGGKKHWRSQPYLY